MAEDKKAENKTSEEKGKLPEEHHEKRAIVVTVIVTLLAVAFIGGLVFAGKKYSDRKKELQSLKEQMENLQKSSGAPAGEITVSGETGETAGTPQAETATDEYTGWKTYANSEIGYTLKYPADWKVKEISQFSEILDATAEYITITSPENKYFLQWGLKKKTDAFVISDRTGIGAGDFQKDGKAMILGKEYDITRFVFKGKTKEVFYPNAGITQTADGKYDFVAVLSYGPGSNYDSLDIDNVSEKAFAEKILKSVSLTRNSSSGSGCAQNFTNEESLTKTGWKTSTNSKYGYSFEYPKEWTIGEKQNDYTSMGSGADQQSFEWRSGLMTETDYYGFKEDSHKNMNIGCQKAKITYLSGDPTADPPGDSQDRLILVQFEKSDKPHLILFSYQYFGASISSDVVEMFDLILKTIKFSK